MTHGKALLTVIASSVAFSVIGGVAGYSLGKFAPGYYRGVFSNGESPQFDPVQVGLGSGVVQGLIAGVIIGLIIVFITAWQNNRKYGP